MDTEMHVFVQECTFSHEKTGNASRASRKSFAYYSRELLACHLRVSRVLTSPLFLPKMFWLSVEVKCYLICGRRERKSRVRL